MAFNEGVAFSYNQLTVVTFPDSLADNQLASVEISQGVDEIYRSAFKVNQFITITISNSVTSIEEKAFISNQLSEVTISMI